MAREVSIIQAEILAQISGQSALSGLTSTSQTAIYRLWAYVIAVVMNIQEQLWDVFKIEIESFVANMIPGTIAWYHEITLAFQYGDALEYINRKYQYAVIDESKKVIKRAAVKEIYGQVRIKISGEDLSGEPVQLSTGVQNAFTAYINAMKFAGTPVAVINQPPDLLNISLSIVYDPLVLNADGSLITDGTYPVEIAIQLFLESIKYGGILNRTKLVDAIQAAAGVIDPVGGTILARTGISQQWITVGQNYEAYSGYFKLDTLTVNYIANV
jgi:hypothetical protein